MGVRKKGDSTSGSSEASEDGGSQREEPSELVDPITLTLMEEAVMVSCGHSFSKASITAWLHQQGVTKTCPVCKTPITEQSILPNWALRNAVDRYNEKHGHQGASSSSPAVATTTEDGDHQVQVHIDVADDHPLKPSAPASVVVDLGSAPSFSSSDEDYTPARPQQPTITSTSTSPSPSPSPSSAYAPTPTVYTPAISPGGYGEAAGDANDGGGGCCDCDCSCQCFDKPTGSYGCCMWECDDCGVCKMADDFTSGSSKTWLLMLPTSFATCSVSFGDWSNWYTRTCCGSIFPIFLVLILVLVCLDLAVMCVLWSVWGLYFPFGMMFFVFTQYFCPCCNDNVKSVCGDMGSFILGNF